MQNKHFTQKVVTLFLFSLMNLHLAGQQGSVCGTPKPAFRPTAVPASYQRTQDISGMRVVRLFIYVTKAEWQGATPAQEEHEILANFEYMRQYFAPTGICFIIVGFGEIVSDEIAFIDPDNSNHFAILQSYASTRPDCLTIFIHNDIAGDVAATAWNIPNKFISLEGPYTWSGFPQLAGHEVGHALGLLHTFETEYGEERVARSGACSNCSIAGDQICDTEADLDIPSQYFSANCTYTGNFKDSCNNPYVMTPTNPMSYHFFLNCPVAYNFTAGQSARLHYTIDNTPFLQNMLLTTSSLTLSTNQNYSNGNYYYVARNNITLNAASFVAAGTTRLQMSSTEISIMPGTTLSPSGGYGITVLRANALCQ